VAIFIVLREFRAQSRRLHTSQVPEFTLLGTWYVGQLIQTIQVVYMPAGFTHDGCQPVRVLTFAR